MFSETGRQWLTLKDGTPDSQLGMIVRHGHVGRKLSQSFSRRILMGSPALKGNVT